MSTEFEGFEGANSGVDITVGGGGNTAYDVITAGGTGTCRFDNAWKHTGNTSMKVTTATGAGNNKVVRHTLGAQTTTHYRRVYFQPNSLPSGTQAIVVFRDGTGALCCQLCLNTNGSYKLQNSGGAIVGANTAVVGANNPIRLELGVTGSIATAKFFYGADLEATVETESRVSATLTQPNIQRIALGGDLAVTFSGNFDDDAFDTAAFVGPKSTPPLGGNFIWTHVVTIG